MSKEQIFKQIEGRIDTAQNMMLECIELIYNAGYNDGIEAALKEINSKSHILLPLAARVEGLKK